MWLRVIQRLLLQLLRDILWFPFWWYTTGFLRAFFGVRAIFSEGNASLAPGLWLKNLFVPMFGQYDMQGRIVSVFVRCGNVIVRGIGMSVWLVLCAMLFSVYLLVPLVVSWGFLSSFLLSLS
jgi:hypothetical protein